LGADLFQRLLAVIFYAVRRVFAELSLLMTTNVAWVESLLVIAALIFVGILAILALLGLLAKSIKRG
jgi:hypothetical protein